MGEQSPFPPWEPRWSSQGEGAEEDRCGPLGRAPSEALREAASARLTTSSAVKSMKPGRMRKSLWGETERSPRAPCSPKGKREGNQPRTADTAARRIKEQLNSHQMQPWTLLSHPSIQGTSGPNLSPLSATKGHGGREPLRNPEASQRDTVAHGPESHPEGQDGHSASPASPPRVTTP